jgi:hypothetical protein
MPEFETAVARLASTQRLYRDDGCAAYTKETVAEIVHRQADYVCAFKGNQCRGEFISSSAC